MTMLSELINDLQKGEVVFFLGAGVSMAAGLPGAKELAARLAERLAYPEGEPPPLKDLATYYDVEGRRPQLNSTLQRTLEEAQNALGGPSPLHRAIARLRPVRYVLTTNWDTLLEEACRAEGRYCNRILTDADVQTISERPEDLNLIKLHGSLEVRDSYIISEDDYDRYERDHPRLRRELEVIFQRYTVVLIGYGLGDDNFRRAYNRVLWELEGRPQRRVYAVDPYVQPFKLGQWGGRNVEFLRDERGELYSAERFLADLETALAGPTTPRPIPPPLPLPPGRGGELADLQETYLRFLREEYARLDFRGIAQVRNILCLPLEEVYVPLSATPEAPRHDALEALAELWAKGERPAPSYAEGPEERLRREAPSRLEARDLVRKYDHLVILGDPGAGKSTLLKHAALALASGRGEERLGLPGQWLPILFPIASYSLALSDDPHLTLSAYLPLYFQSRELPDLSPLLNQELEAGRGCVLIDGLDEVLDIGQRRLVVSRVEDFVRHYDRNRFIVTSRIAGYADARLGDVFNHATIVPFNDEDIVRFAQQWCLAYERIGEEGESEWAAIRARAQARQLVVAIRASDRVRRLAGNPLLLTILALIHYQNVRLPHRRVELYHLCVEALAETWNRRRNLAGRQIELNLGEARLGEDFVVRMLGPVALKLHGARPGGLVERDELRRQLEALFVEDGEKPGRARRYALDFIDLIRRGSGLLQERGADLYGFMHLTFEEYLAARAITDLLEDPIGFLHQIWPDPAWREVIRLAVGASRRREATRLLREGLIKAPTTPQTEGRQWALAGECLLDLDPHQADKEVWEDVTDGLLKTMVASLLPARTRAEAGTVLGQLGDPRDLEELVEVPAGPFLMGSDRGDELAFDDEYPQHEIDLESFRIGKYPVTNAQYRRFIEAGGYHEERFWTKAGWEHIRKEGRAQPAWWEEYSRRPNHPVVGVTWYEAVAYCRWLTEVWREAGLLAEGEEVRLPTEAQWEKAAAWDAEKGEKRRWPWGDEFDEGRCNTGESGIEDTTPVGLYPRGASPWGALDMAGNVWEWCSSLYRPYPYADDGREDLEAEGSRALRGGSWFNLLRLARCASRNATAPTSSTTTTGFRVVVVGVAP